MKRILMQVYVKNRAEAFEFYKNVFNADVGFCDKDKNGNIIHAELKMCGQYMAVGEYYYEPKEIVIGNTMQFCLHFDKGEEDIIKRAYETMQIEGNVITPLGPCFFSPYMADLIDKYGVHWCLFI
jgi:PhnB protein